MSDLPRCATCRFWEVRPNALTPFADQMWPCRKTAHNGTYPEDPTTLANAFSMDESDSVLMTAPVFGCVMHEPHTDA